MSINLLEKEFDELITRLAPQLEDLEELRVRTRKSNSKVLMLTAPLLFLLVVCFILTIHFNLSGYYRWLIISGIAGLLLYAFYKIDASYTRKLKTEVLPRIVKLYDKSIRYKEVESEFDFSTINKLLDTSSITAKKITDTIKGNYKGVKFRLGEVRAYTDSSGSSSSKIQVFNGLYGKFSFNKNFKHTTLVTFSDFFNPINYNSLFKGGLTLENKIKLENPEFEKKFDVFSTDQTEARYILSTSFMERIMELETHFDGFVKVLFRNGNMYIAIYTFNDFFKVDAKRSLLDPDVLKAYLYEFGLLLELIDILKLDEKLWSKQ